MGTATFYLEFLLAFTSLLSMPDPSVRCRFRNPYLFALDYTLVPDGVYPTQIQQALSGYEFALSLLPPNLTTPEIKSSPSRIADNSRASKIVVSGDSAGGTVVLSLLLHMANFKDYVSLKPSLACLISPWTALRSKISHNTTSDYLDIRRLNEYAKLYIAKASISDPIVNPGSCDDMKWWARATPRLGFQFLYGSEEVFAPEIRQLAERLQGIGAVCDIKEEVGGIHAWPVASLFLGDTREDRLDGLIHLTRTIREKLIGGRGDEN
jgi:acetyl esterase/lipase